jgi:hypothetical protein
MKKGAQLNFQFAEDTKAKAAGAKLLQTPRPRPRGQSEAWRAQGALNPNCLVILPHWDNVICVNPNCLVNSPH